MIVSALVANALAANCCEATDVCMVARATNGDTQEIFNVRLRSSLPPEGQISAAVG